MDPAAKVQPNTLGGRVHLGCEGTAVRHLFGSVSTPIASVDDYLAFPLATSHRDGHLGGGCHHGRIYAVSLTGRDLIRVSDEIPIGALPISAFDLAPAGAVLTQRSQLKFQIDAYLDSGKRTFQADAGQTFHVEATRVQVSWLAPTNFVEVNDATASAAGTRTGMVLDSLMGASVAATESSVGDDEVVYTTHLFVPANTQPAIAIPPFADRVTIYQNTGGAASVLWTQHYGDPAVASIEASTLPWIPGGRRTHPESVMHDATHLQPDLDPDNARFYTLRWSIRP